MAGRQLPMMLHGCIVTELTRRIYCYILKKIGKIVGLVFSDTGLAFDKFDS